MRTLRARPLTKEGYAPFGEVLEGSGAPSRGANQGTAKVWDRLVSLKNRRAGAEMNASVFRCAPRDVPFEIALLERHPQSSQLFVPMNARRFLVVVARGDERPDPQTIEVFVAGPTQGVSYHPGTWHAPMIALDAAIDFGCFVFEDGTAGDCEVVALDPSERVLVEP